MSQENVEVARALIEALNRGDWDAAVFGELDVFELDLSRAIGPDAGVYKGIAQVRRWWDRLTESWEAVSFEPNEFIPVDEHVVVPVTMRARGRDGIEVASRPVGVFTFDNRAAARVRMYQERDEALEAVGLRE